LKYNESTKIIGGKDYRFSNNLFHVDARHISIMTSRDDTLHRIKDNDVSLSLEDLARDTTNSHRVLDIVNVDCVRFKFDVNICHVLGSKKNVSRFVDYNLLNSKGGPAEFRREKYGGITMHLPISVDVNHTGRFQESKGVLMEEDEPEEEEQELLDDADVDHERARVKRRWYARSY
jgi:hypothetical protein